jgi:hypothetical protein
MTNIMDNKLKYPLIVGILVVLLLIVGVWAINESRDEVDNTAERMEADIREQQQMMKVACSSASTSTTAKADCDAALEDFSEVLLRYQAELKDVQQEVDNENE